MSKAKKLEVKELDLTVLLSIDTLKVKLEVSRLLLVVGWNQVKYTTIANHDEYLYITREEALKIVNEQISDKTQALESHQNSSELLKKEIAELKKLTGQSS
ncbi:hypothetical protein ACFL13_02315 [Patescibacteria group bacterium]